METRNVRIGKGKTVHRARVGFLYTIPICGKGIQRNNTKLITTDPVTCRHCLRILAKEK